MKKILTLGVTLLALAGLTACQSDDATLESNGRTVTLRVGVSRPDASETRTSMNIVDGVLTCTWKDGDQILVSDPTSGASKGYLTLEQGAGETFGYFYGTLHDVPDGDAVPLVFTYLGDGKKVSEDIKNTYTVDVSEQDGTLAGLAKYDALYQYNSTVKIENGVGYSENLNLQRQMAFAHFTLNLPNGVKRGNEPITISGTNIKPYVQLKLDKNNRPLPVDGTITVNGSGNDIYLALVPAAGAETITCNFSVKIGGITYTGTTTRNGELKAGIYYSDTNDQSKGFKIDMVAKIGNVNPLEKWAETDLYCVSRGTSATSDFRDDPLQKGDYYQFGRNVGYSSSSAAASGNTYAVEVSMTGVSPWPGDGTTNIISCYNQSTTFSKIPNHFLIDGSHNGDYRTPAKGENWFERAITNGYSYDSPCPEGWTIPSIKDWQEIMPDASNGGHGYLGFGIWEGDGLTQIKTMDDGTRCAFRWSGYADTDYNCYFMRIECRVIDDSITSIPNDDNFWNANNGVKVRDFRAYGYIYGGCVKSRSGYWIARPLDWGSILINNSYPPRFVYSERYMNYGGYFWASDAAQKALNVIMDVDNKLTIESGLYLAGFNNAVACPIRCIKKQ